MTIETPVESLVRAAELAGGQSALAAELTARGKHPVSPARVWNWINRDGGAPAEYCLLIEEIVDRQVTRQQLRANDWQTIWPPKEVAHGQRTRNLKSAHQLATRQEA